MIQCAFYDNCQKLTFCILKKLLLDLSDCENLTCLFPDGCPAWKFLSAIEQPERILMIDILFLFCSLACCFAVSGSAFVNWEEHP